MNSAGKYIIYNASAAGSFMMSTADIHAGESGHPSNYYVASDDPTVGIWMADIGTAPAGTVV